jgi:hypothetical protein
MTTPQELATELAAMRLDYLEMALVIAMQEGYPNDFYLSDRRIDRSNHLYNIDCLIVLLKEMQQP